MTVEEIISRYRKAKVAYAYTGDIMVCDDREAAFKRALSLLPQVDRIIIILYAECRSCRQLGRILGVSHTTAMSEVHRIRKEIMEIYGRIR